MKKWYIIVLIILMSFTNLVSVHADEKKVIRVGYPIQSGLTEKDSEGNYIGYTVEYLNEIKKYTGWDYEFVEVEGSLNEQLTTLLEMLQEGTIDMMGAMVYNDVLAEIYDYPGYSYGMAYTTIAVLKENAEWITDDFQNWKEIKIATYDGMKIKEKQLEQFASVTGISYKLVEYESQAEVVEAVRKGEVDGTLQVDISLEDDMKSIAKFSPVPYYFALSKGKQNLVRQLNSALTSIDIGNPYLQASLYNKYFTVNNKFYISDENREYIESLGKVKVLMLDGNAPIQYYDEEAKGISISYLEKIKEETGLQYEIIVAKTYDDCLKKLEEEDIDLMIGVPSNSDFFQKTSMTISIPYLDSHTVLVSNELNDKKYEVEKTEKTGSHNTEKILDTLNRNKNEIAYLDAYCTNFYLQQGEKYKNLEVDINERDSIQYSIGVLKSENTRLLSIINSYISSMSDEKKQELIYENMMINISYTFIDLLELYSWQIITTILVLLFVGILIHLRNVKERNSMMGEIVLQHKRFNELSNLTDECLFEYDYKKDLLNIQNNKVLFDQRQEIEHYMENGEYEFLREMLQKKEDGSHDFILKIMGEEKWYRLILKVIKNEYGEVTYAIGKVYDVDEEVLEHRALIEKSERDTLTKLFNRPAAQKYIHERLQMDNSKGILIIFDVDNFKLVNDTLGHPVGDKLLKEISHFIEYYFRKNDIKCRLGGDEFLVFVHTKMNYDDLAQKLEQFLFEINRSVFAEYQNCKVSMSIGATFVGEDANTYEQLYEKADSAMYVAKLGGKNRFSINDTK